MCSEAPAAEEAAPDDGLLPAPAEGDERPPSAPYGSYDWRCGAARMGQAAAASRQSGLEPGLPAPTAVGTIPPGSTSMSGRLQAQTASSRAKLADQGATQSSPAAGRQRHSLGRSADRPAAQGQRARLAALALVRQQ